MKLNSFKALSILLYCGSTIAYPMISGKLLDIVAPSSITSSSLSNVYIDNHDSLPQFLGESNEDVTFVLSACDSNKRGLDEHVIKQYGYSDALDVFTTSYNIGYRFLWRSPSHFSHDQVCIKAYNGDVIIGKSDPITITTPQQPSRRDDDPSIVSQIEEFDSLGEFVFTIYQYYYLHCLGTWFDGVQYVDSHFQESFINAKPKDSSKL